MFGLAQWLGKGGYGGEMGFRGDAMDPLLITAGLAPVTRNIVLISTVHVLYGWHPVHLAKFAATLDHMSRGRWGLNMVTGYKPDEFRMFGLAQIEHDLRYEMAGEFVDMMDMREAQRSYEAHLSVIKASRGMLQSTIDVLR